MAPLERGAKERAMQITGGFSRDKADRLRRHGIKLHQSCSSGACYLRGLAARFGYSQSDLQGQRAIGETDSWGAPFDNCRMEIVKFRVERIGVVDISRVTPDRSPLP